MKPIVPLLAGLSLLAPAATAQNTRPRLVVGIVVDQMRWDFLQRYNYSPTGGLRRMMEEGFRYENMHYDYVPTVTGPGHASVYTGAAPGTSGIAANTWYDRAAGRNVYCVDDAGVTAVGGSPESGKMSPRNLLVTTVGDQLRLATRGRAKVVGVALKDRGSILPAGHAGAAYWWDRQTGQWMTSSYYSPTLPDWVNRLNKQALPDSFLKAGWQPLLPLAQYTASTSDNQPYERIMAGNKTATLPAVLNETPEGGYDELAFTPWGNELTYRFSTAAIEGEGLGQDDITDLLCISFSSTDYAGHAFGPDALELEDMYLKLDRTLGQLLGYLDQKVGRGQYTVFLTADHGAANCPEVWNSMGYGVKRIVPADLTKALEEALRTRFGSAGLAMGPYISQYIDQQVYFNTKRLDAEKADLEDVTEWAARWLEAYPQVARAYAAEELREPTTPVLAMHAAGWHPQRSGDVWVAYQPGVFEAYGTPPRGTTHGAHYSYDTHVPMLWFGAGLGQGLPTGRSYRRVGITQVAPTVAAILGIEFPNGSHAQVLDELLPENIRR